MKINFEYDTVTKQLIATSDGQAISDLSEVTICKCYSPDDEPDVFSVRVEKAKIDKANKTMHREVVYASHQAKIKTNLLKDFK